MKTSERAPQQQRLGASRPWCAAVCAAWAAGAFLFAAPFNAFWRLGNGNLGHNILITLACALLGIAVLVPLARWQSRRLSRERPRLGTGATVAQLAFVAAAALVLFAGWPGWVLLAATAVLLVAIGILTAEAKRDGRAIIGRRSLGGWMRRRWSFNGGFWLAVFVLLAAGDLYALWAIDGLNTLERWSAALGRVATQAVLTIALMLLFHAARGLTPKTFRPLVAVLFSLLPIIIAADFLLRRFWNQSLLNVVNLFTSTGAFDLQKEVAASGIGWAVWQILAVGAGCVLLSASVFWALGKLSRSAGFRTANRYVFRALVACWLVAIAEGGLSHATKRVEAWQQHHKAFGIHVALFSPPVGLETMEVEFVEPAPEPAREALLAGLEDAPHLRKPDVYVFMVESWRSDSVRPEVAPFLTQFRREECQDLGRTFAGSNCTPLSWFSFFHSRVALHWSDALEALESGETDAGAYPLRVLDKIGYEVHVRAVCDLGYKSMGPLNFGAGGKLADRYIDDSKPEVGPRSTIPQREQAAMADLIAHLETDPGAPQFHFTALDSPHYNYYWPTGFQVLHQDCASNVPKNIRPGKGVVEGVVRRYENSVHWVDAAIAEFVDFLKFRERYDDAVIIITGDHGEEFQEDGSWFHCSALNRYQTEVPIIIKWPSWLGETPAHTNVGHMDVMPSLLDLIGLEPEFYAPLSGRSLLKYDEAPREAIISTYHRGETGIGLCVVSGERKAKFVFGGPWSMNIPSKLHFTGYSDLSDQRIDASAELGEGGSYTDLIKAEFPGAGERFFGKFERD